MHQVWNIGTRDDLLDVLMSFSSEFVIGCLFFYFKLALNGIVPQVLYRVTDSLSRQVELTICVTCA